MTIRLNMKNMRDRMRVDAGLSGDAQRLEQMSWMMYLKVFDDMESEWEFEEDDYRSLIPEDCRWRNWGHNDRTKNVLTGDDLLDFVNNRLFPTLKGLPVDERTPQRQAIVREVFAAGLNNYMKDGIVMREILDMIDEVDFTDPTDRHTFNDMYEGLLKEMQASGAAGEFYTPRAVTDFIVEMVAPTLDDKVADFACGTGGFLTSTLKFLSKDNKTTEDNRKYMESVYGIEKKPFPYLLCITNLLLHGIQAPNVLYGNTLETSVYDYTDKDRFDVIIMNPPYGGSEKEIVKNNFPTDLRSSETADLFVDVIMYRLKERGRAAVILPDGFLFGSDVKTKIKEKLLREFNLHTVIRLPSSVFAPYTSITTNILFFDRTGPTRQTWFYRMDMPEGLKHFSKTKPIRLEHFDVVKEWWNNRVDIVDDNDKPKSRCYTIEEIRDGGYNLDLCGFPNEVKEVLPPDVLIAQFKERRAALEASMDEILGEIERIMDETDGRSL